MDGCIDRWMDSIEMRERQRAHTKDKTERHAWMDGCMHAYMHVCLILCHNHSQHKAHGTTQPAPAEDHHILEKFCARAHTPLHPVATVSDHGRAQEHDEASDQQQKDVEQQAEAKILHPRFPASLRERGRGLGEFQKAVLHNDGAGQDENDCVANIANDSPDAVQHMLRPFRVDGCATVARHREPHREHGKHA